MDIKVLVTYATKYGATTEIAEKIGQVLRQAGLHTEVHPIDRIIDLNLYKAVVVGSAVYIGRWRKEAVKFLKANEKALTDKKVWLFSSGPTGEGNPVELTDGWQFPKALQPLVDRIKPQDITLFHGTVEPEKLNSLHKWMMNKVESPIGDFRDWEAISSWAKAIAEALMTHVAESRANSK
jgi:menaquinone-dependent protoporphyrinogen oxidase